MLDKAKFVVPSWVTSNATNLGKTKAKSGNWDMSDSITLTFSGDSHTGKGFKIVMRGLLRVRANLGGELQFQSQK